MARSRRGHELGHTVGELPRVPHRHRGPTQRLWVLERPDGAVAGSVSVCRFTGALAILGGSSVHLVFVRSSRPEGTEESCLESRGLRLDVQRDAVSFGTLDAALAWADVRKRAWLRRGWTELTVDRSDG